MKENLRLLIFSALAAAAVFLIDLFIVNAGKESHKIATKKDEIVNIKNENFNTGDFVIVKLSGQTGQVIFAPPSYTLLGIRVFNISNYSIVDFYPYELNKIKK